MYKKKSRVCYKEDKNFELWKFKNFLVVFVEYMAEKLKGLEFNRILEDEHPQRRRFETRNAATAPPCKITHIAADIGIGMLSAYHKNRCYTKRFLILKIKFDYIILVVVAAARKRKNRN